MLARHRFLISLLVIGLLLIPVNHYLVPNSSGTSTQTWWNTDWQYYKTIEVSNPAINYQLRIVVEYDTGLDASANISCEGHCQTDFDDLRFIYDNTTELSYWFENVTSSSSCTIWVNISIYNMFEMYYGNLVVGNVSHMRDTMLYAEPEAGLAANWVGSLTLSDDTDIFVYGNSSIKFLQPSPSAWIQETYLFADNYVADNIVFEMITRPTGDVFYNCLAETTTYSAGQSVYTKWEASGESYVQYDGSYADILASFSDDTWYKVTLMLDLDTPKILQVYVDDVLCMSNEDFWYQDDLNYFFVRLYGTTDTGYLDSFWFRTYASVEPGVGEVHSMVDYNDSPVFSNLDPFDGETGVAVDVGAIRLDIEDPEGDTFGFVWACSDGSSNSAMGNTNGSKIFMFDYGDLICGTVYYWWVNATDEHGAYTNSSYSFTTVACSNVPPVVVDVYPVNESVNVSISYLRCWVNVSDVDDEQYNISFRSDCTGDWIRFGYNSSISVDVNASQFLGNMTWYNRTCSWCYNISDGSENWVNGTVWFTTMEAENASGSVGGGTTMVVLPVEGVDYGLMLCMSLLGCCCTGLLSLVWRRRKK